MYKGCDISSVQEHVNFAWLKAQGFEFVVSKCYTGNDADGKDPFYTTNIAQTKANGMLAACYQFIYPLPNAPGHPNRDPVSQANMHFNASGGELAAIDLEWPAPEDFSKWGCSPSQLQDWILKYLECYTQLSGQKPIVYTYPYWSKAVGFSSDFAQYPLWIASYEPTPQIPSPWSDWVIWQTSGGGLLTLPNGIKTDTDMAKDLSWWNVAAPTQTIQPAPIVIQTPQPTIPDTVVTPDPTPVTATVPAASSTLDTIKSIASTLWPAIKTIFHL